MIVANELSLLLYGKVGGKMLKRILCPVSLIVIVLTGLSCGKATTFQVNLNEEFSLSLGQCASLTGENLELKFREVTEDSRCPKDVTCVWAGRVTCEVELRRAGSLSLITLTEPGLTDEYSRQKHEEYELAFHITPYPEDGKDIPADAYRLHLIITRLPEWITGVIGSVLAAPPTFDGQEITIVGYYRGWDLLHEANMAPPVTRSDWVIKDSTGAIYVSANSVAKLPESLRPGSLQDTGTILKVKGVVRVTSAGQPYVEAKSIERMP
jgi:hypothetical protein